MPGADKVQCEVHLQVALVEQQFPVFAVEILLYISFSLFY